MLPLLTGLRVLELAVEPPLNTTSMFLADLGAEVIKVERPPTGDFTRDVGALATELRTSAFHLTLSRNKKSLTLDVRTEAGKRIFFELVATADILVQTSAPGTPEKLGIGYDQCRDAKPDLVYVSLSGYGDTGPYSQYPAHGLCLEAFLGNARPGRTDDGRLTTVMPPPVSPGPPAHVGGLVAAIAALAGIAHRNQTGEGCYLETSLADAGLWWQYMAVFDHCNAYDVAYAPELGAGAVRYNFYECADGEALLFGAVEKKYWDIFCDVAERPDLKSRGNWAHHQDFGDGDADLEITVVEIFKTMTRAEWLEQFAARVPVSPAFSFGELLDERDIMDGRGMLVRYDHPGLGPVTLAANPIKWPGHAFEVVHPAPEVGHDNEAVLTELGYGDDELAQLRVEGAIFG